jgi:hypothetical protein
MEPLRFNVMVTGHSIRSWALGTVKLDPTEVEVSFESTLSVAGLSSRPVRFDLTLPGVAEFPLGRAFDLELHATEVGP